MKQEMSQIYFIKKTKFKYFSRPVKKLVYKIFDVILRRHFKHYNKLYLMAPVIITKNGHTSPYSPYISSIHIPRITAHHLFFRYINDLYVLLIY